MPFPVVAALAAGAALGGGAINAASTGNQNRKNREFTREMYGRQRADALADYHMQNAYNTPQEQMKRLQQAGLNPNLVYGNGADAQGGSVAQVSAGTPRTEAPQFDLPQVVDTFFSVKQAQQQLTNQAAVGRQIELDNNNKELQNQLMTQDLATKSFNNSMNVLYGEKGRQADLHNKQFSASLRQWQSRNASFAYETMNALNAERLRQTIGAIRLDNQGRIIDNNGKVIQNRIALSREQVEAKNARMAHAGLTPNGNIASSLIGAGVTAYDELKQYFNKTRKK